MSRKVRVALPAGLRALARVGGEVIVRVDEGATRAGLLDALEADYPVLRGTIRDHGSKKRRPYIRFFACREDFSHQPDDAALPVDVVEGREVFLIVGAIVGG